MNEPIKHGAARASRTSELIKMHMIFLRRFSHGIPDPKARGKKKPGNRIRCRKKAKMVCCYQYFLLVLPRYTE